MTAVWYLSEHRMYTYPRTVLVLGGMLALVILIMAAFGVAGLVLVLWKGKMLPLASAVVNVPINLLFPVALKVGKLVGIKEDRIKSSFIEVNNQLTLMKKLRVQPDDILILAPHCLQFNGCPHKITRDLRNCKQCGKCQVNDFVNIMNEAKVNVAVVTGGTLARKCIVEYTPKVVIAVACERDLTSGILDSHPIPVYGVLNERPNGPCQDTQVDILQVRSAINKFIEGR